MGYFPFFVDIKEKNGLIVGGGTVAVRKIRKLLPFGPKLKVVSPAIQPELLEIAQNTEILLIQREFQEEDLQDAFFVIASSDNSKLNSQISRLCREKGVLVNVVDNKEHCNFLFPALVHRGALTIGVTTAGASPESAAAIKNEIAAVLPANIEEILDYLAKLRELAKETICDSKVRAQFLKEMARLCMESNGIFDEKETKRKLAAFTQKKDEMLWHQTNNMWEDCGSVTLVGAGCGSYELITLKGLRAIRYAQVIVYDDLIDRRLLDYAAESCECIYVGKRSGRHSMSQEEINVLLLQKAKEGKRVIRLKGGDPFVFGRGGEELQALNSEQIPTAYIPGITSAVAVPAFAGIPVTHREISRSFHVITGYTSAANNMLPEDIETIAKQNGTLVFLMGLAHLAQITQALMEYGRSPETPVAVIHGNIDNTTETVRGTLLDIIKKVEQSKIIPPAVIVVGETAGMKL